MNNKKIRCKNCKKYFVKIGCRKYCDCCRKIKLVYQHQFNINNPNKSKETQKRYRQRNLYLCRERTRLNQKQLNNTKRFGGNREQILERDKYICQMCQKDVSKKYQACVHHKDCDKTNHSLNNLITVCKKCHTTFHYHEDKKLYEHQFNSKQIKQIWKERGKAGFNR